MKQLPSVNESNTNLVERYLFDTAEECGAFVTAKRSNGEWAFTEWAGFEHGKAIPSKIACIRREGHFLN